MVFSKNSNSLSAKCLKGGYKLLPETHSLQSGLKAKNKTLMSSMSLVAEQDIINTYSVEEQLSCKKYTEYKELIKQNPSFGYKRCAKLLGVPQGRTRWWHTKGEKKAVPLALKAVKKLKEAGLLPFTSEHKHVKIVLNILGTLFGDGGIDRRLNTMAFISADKRDVDLWKNDLVEVFPFAKNKMNVVKGGEWGHSYNMRTFDRAVIRFFVALGTPVGDKIITPYSLPSWIGKIKPAASKCFLDGLLSSEVSIPKFIKRIYGVDYFKNFSLSLSKSMVFEASHMDFMDSLRKQFKLLDIMCTPNLRKDVYRKEPRKDGHISNGYRIFFRVGISNVLQFHKIFPLRYCFGKKEKFDKEIKKAQAANPALN